LSRQCTYDANCVFKYEYNPGTGSGETGWAPIMGNSYSKNLSLWHNGTTNQGCNKYQDDLAIIGSNTNGFGYRADDVEATTNKATGISINGQSLSANALINTASDLDMFKIVMPDKGRLTLNVAPFTATNGSANLDIDVERLNNSGALNRAFNPSDYISFLI